ncbi:uncharacterized protein LOC120431010 [Culex pipiens pallens]|uniref:uncharacterized protein LOC120431010 n=1 Tax=Culex pipiens pallens TaxID=42434 RepID=UPI00195355B1|nr:uncharacterized protein LOC120431010 [Culex pipiens pallens]XP_052562664.1 uncharacterized protein LOC120431010 [Culex pipiens pallens]XP_052562666.1 uncharacterized protein LOC120431010 [Culex pipiens pallens]XP_052562667.1 uncharacterized protein LOC120431010 [Culex pipiens pallens]
MSTASVLAGVQDYCPKCAMPDVGSELVTCGKCQRWYHGRCAGKCEEFLDGSWTCKQCLAAGTEPARSTSSVSSSRSLRIKLQLMRLEEEKEAKEKRLRERQEQDRIREERAQREKEDLDSKYLDDKYALLITDAIEEDEEIIEEAECQQNVISKVDEWINYSGTEIAGRPDDDVLSLTRSDVAGTGDTMHPPTPLSALGAKVIFSYDPRTMPSTFRMGHVLFTSTPMGVISPEQPEYNEQYGLGTNILSPVLEGLPSSSSVVPQFSAPSAIGQTLTAGNPQQAGALPIPPAASQFSAPSAIGQTLTAGNPQQAGALPIPPAASQFSAPSAIGQALTAGHPQQAGATPTPPAASQFSAPSAIGQTLTAGNPQQAGANPMPPAASQFSAPSAIGQTLTAGNPQQAGATPMPPAASQIAAPSAIGQALTAGHPQQAGATPTPPAASQFSAPSAIGQALTAGHPQQAGATPMPPAASQFSAPSAIGQTLTAGHPQQAGANPMPPAASQFSAPSAIGQTLTAGNPQQAGALPIPPAASQFSAPSAIGQTLTAGNPQQAGALPLPPAASQFSAPSAIGQTLTAGNPQQAGATPMPPAASQFSAPSAIGQTLTAGNPQQAGANPMPPAASQFSAPSAIGQTLTAGNPQQAGALPIPPAASQFSAPSAIGQTLTAGNPQQAGALPLPPAASQFSAPSAIGQTLTAGNPQQAGATPMPPAASQFSAPSAIGQTLTAGNPQQAGALPIPPAASQFSAPSAIGQTLTAGNPQQAGATPMPPAASQFSAPSAIGQALTAGHPQQAGATPMPPAASQFSAPSAIGQTLTAGNPQQAGAFSWPSGAPQFTTFSTTGQVPTAEHPQPAGAFSWPPGAPQFTMSSATGQVLTADQPQPAGAFSWLPGVPQFTTFSATGQVPTSLPSQLADTFTLPPGVQRFSAPLTVTCRVPPSQYPPQAGGYSHAANATVLNGSSTQPVPEWHRDPASLHQQRMAARQVVPKELPVFTGNPEDWPLFISSYRNSTEMCGFTDAENMMRLQKCLRGYAMEIAHSSLLHPSTVPQAIATLEMLCGNPERLIQTLLQKVKNTPAPKADRLETLINFGVVVQNLVGHLLGANQQAHLTNPSLLRELVDKLPPHICLDWAIYKKRFAVVSLETFSHYMKEIIVAVSDVARFSEADEPKPNRHDKQKPKEKGFLNAHAAGDNLEQDKANDRGGKTTAPGKPCFICQKSGHRVRECFTYKALPLNDRWKAVQAHQLCPRCLVPHGRWPCRTSSSCDVSGCSENHHALLHPGPPNATPEKTLQTTVVSIHQHPESPTMFRIVPVVLHGKSTRFETFAFLDEGSELTLMDAEIADALGLQGESRPLCLKWTSGVTRDESDSKQITLEISGVKNEKRFPLVNVRTVHRLDLPTQTLEFERLAAKYPHLQKLPVQSYENVTPKLLIGLNNLQLALPLKCRTGRGNEPVAAKTKLGWTVFGSTAVSDSAHSFHVCDCTKDGDLHELVKEFFAFESLGVTNSPLPESVEEIRAKAILNDTTKKCADGHFETGLLWRYDQFEFPPSYAMALGKLQCLERRLRKHPELRANLDKQIIEYQTKGYAHKATALELEGADPKRGWYLPLGVITNPKKPEKVRIIWDAAAKVNGVSFNSMLLKGPDMLTSLSSVLFRFRERKFCITADIKEMYHQVKIRPEDRLSQRFLYRSDPSHQPDTYVMDVATFGSTCSPCSAQFVKNLNAERWRESYPEAAETIVQNHYVDDYLDSRDTEEEIIKLSEDIRTVHSKAGFEIRNWRSNSHEVLRRVGAEPANVKKMLFVDKAVPAERVLGMTWLPTEDMFTFSVILSDDLQRMILGVVAVTKRGVLRVLMSLFDPHGLISNFLIHGKIIIQDLWRSGVSWDEPIPRKIREQWERWINLLQNLSRIRIPCCYFPGYHVEDLKTLELHVFVDASESAYACVAYFRIIQDGKPRCVFVTSKAKVTPLKSVSVPRLELNAGVIGCRLAKTIKENTTLPISRTVYWTDSSTLLSWIRSDTRKYRQYVAVRVGEILETTDISEWRWVPTKLNVADEATKWGKGPNVDPDSRWFLGPEFLYQLEELWPQQRLPEPDTTEELRPIFMHREIIRTPFIDVSRFSKWERLLRSTAHVFHWGDRTRAPASERQPSLVKADFERAEWALWRLAQADSYADEVVELTVHSKDKARRLLRLDTGSKIRHLSPFLDEHGVIRMEGRIEASPFAPYDAKYPIILPRAHYITELLIDWYHRRFGHGFGETVVNEIRQRFHISNLRVLVREYPKKCNFCKMEKAEPEVPRMAPLPAARVTPHERAFTRVGIDYCGPFAVRFGRGTVKRWVALFTCLATRAVHLEVVASLSTESCKLALRRFINRRGAPAEIYTDNGTNFQGTQRELLEQVQDTNRSLAETFTDANTSWFFIPPATPHMGGAWERMVRSVKAAYKRHEPQQRKCSRQFVRKQSR